MGSADPLCIILFDGDVRAFKVKPVFVGTIVAQDCSLPCCDECVTVITGVCDRARVGLYVSP